MRRRLIPHPLQSLILLGAWLLLSQRFSVGQLLLGMAFAIALPLLLTPFHVTAPPLRRVSVLIGLLLRVLGDIVVASLQVARGVLGPNSRLQPAFVELPLDISHDVAIAILASIITLTPGTVSADLSRDRRRLLIHTLSAADREALVAEIKQRYEAPLKEAFEC